MKWLESLKKTNNIIDLAQTEAITVCDREADMHDFFELAHNLNSAILVRALHNRNVNKNSCIPGTSKNYGHLSKASLALEK